MHYFVLLLCLLLQACYVPALFLEEEGAKFAEDLVEEEEKIDNSPLAKVSPTK